MGDSPEPMPIPCDLSKMILVAFFSLLLVICPASAQNDSVEIPKGIDGYPDSFTKVDMGPYLTQGLDRSQLRDPLVKAALSRVPRHRFVPEALAEQAYEDAALAIGKGQTISQPFIVALMTEQAKIQPNSKVLEIGTGSGYQSAVLAELGAKVFSIEILPELAERARKIHAELGYTDRITARVGDGWAGWVEEAPFDAIIVTAAAPRIPPKLIAQLTSTGGRLVIPVEENEGEPGTGRAHSNERLLVLEKQGERLITRDLGGVRFVPLTGEARNTNEALKSEFPMIEHVLGVTRSIFQGSKPGEEIEVDSEDEKGFSTTEPLRKK